MKWVLVTGAALRLGAAIAKKLADQGHAVVIHYNTHEKQARELSAHCLGSEIIQGDFANSLEDFIGRYKERFPNTKGLINNVGNYALGAPSSLSNIDTLLQTNLTAPMSITHALLPFIKKAKGHIINIGSANLSNPWTYATPYGISKAALLFYTLSLAKELLGDVRVNMVSPGYLDISEDLPSTVQPVKVLEAAHLIATLFEQNCITGQNVEVSFSQSIYTHPSSK